MKKYKKGKVNHKKKHLRRQKYVFADFLSIFLQGAQDTGCKSHWFKFSFFVSRASTWLFWLIFYGSIRVWFSSRCWGLALKHLVQCGCTGDLILWQRDFLVYWLCIDLSNTSIKYWHIKFQLPINHQIFLCTLWWYRSCVAWLSCGMIDHFC